MSFRPLKMIITLNGQTCRHFRSTMAFVDTVEFVNGTACQQVDGNWKTSLIIYGNRMCFGGLGWL